MNHKFMLPVILFAALILGIIYIIVIPPWQSPDEPTHFEYAKVLAEGDSPWAPHPRPELQAKIIISMDRHDYWRYVLVNKPSPLPSTFRKTPFLYIAPTQIGKKPPLYYWIAAQLLRVSSNLSIEAELYRLRALSLFFSIMTVAFVWACAAEIFGSSSPICWSAAGFTVLLPQFMIIGTSVSPDPCINLFGAIIIYMVLRFQRKGLTLPRILILFLVTGLGLLINHKGFILLAILPGIIFINLIFGKTRLISWKKAITCLGLGALLIVFSYSTLIWFVPEVARVFIIKINILFSTLNSFLQGKTYFFPGFWNWFNSELFKTFWLKYGWLKFELPLSFYLILKIASLIALTGICLFFIKSMLIHEKIYQQKFQAVLTLLLYAAGTLAAYYLFWGLKGDNNTTTQSRHLFIVMPAWAIFFVFGWHQFFPAHWAKGVSIGLMAGFALLNITAIIFHIIPTFSR